MSATANPNFDLEQQALGSLRRIHQICYILEAIQLASSALMITLGHWARPMHVYGAMLYIFSAVFAHIVVFQVLTSIGSNLRQAHESNPSRPQEWLVYAANQIAGKIFPYVFTHAVILFSLLAVGLSGHQVAHHQAGAWAAAIVGVVCFVRIRFALIENSEYLTRFVRGGGYATTQAVIEH